MPKQHRNAITSGACHFTHVCFQCRKTYRHPISINPSSAAEMIFRVCSGCNRKCVAISSKLRVPKSSDDDGWRKLQVLVRNWRREFNRERTVQRDVKTRPLAAEIKQMRRKKKLTKGELARIEVLECEIEAIEKQFRSFLFR